MSKYCAQCHPYKDKDGDKCTYNKKEGEMIMYIEKCPLGKWERK